MLISKSHRSAKIPNQMIYSHWYLFKWYTYMLSTLLIKTPEDIAVHLCYKLKINIDLLAA